MDFRAVIIGAGPGGLAAALALHGQGIAAQVYDQASSLRPSGTGLTLFPNGLSSLAAIDPGICADLRAAGSPTQVVTLQNASGEVLLRTPITYAEIYGQPMLGITWFHQQRILATALPPHALHLNHRCIGFTHRGDQVEVHFAGKPPVQADLLIGADGVHSVVRQTLFAEGSPRAAGRQSWRAVIPKQPGWITDNAATIIAGMDGKTLALLDAGDQQLFWSAGMLTDVPTEPPDPATIHARVLREFGGWPEPVPAVLAATSPAAIVERPIVDRPPLARWSRGAVTLLGDAAHPMVPALGQGANTAFEDAVELALYLSKSTSVEAALARYEASRIPRSQVIQARSALQGSRAYEPDHQRYLRGVAEQAQTTQAAFEHWLYGYRPPVS